MLLSFAIAAQNPFVSSVWVADNGDGTYTNPVIYADYSDPDVIRVGDDFWMTASSFNCVPGLPILHSKDLVNWQLVNHAIDRQYPYDHFSSVRHGGGVWAPSIRFHNGMYYIYWGDPDFGIYMVKTDNPAGKWSEPILVKEGKGLIDPSPLWDDDGRAYLVYARAGSRAGIKDLLLVAEMAPCGTRVINSGKIVFSGHTNGQVTVEGPKFYRYNGYYYIFAPAGGVTYGWQLVLRSKNVYGPYDFRVVMHQGSTSINGPHQGGWVKLESGEHWFVHFNDQYAFGRVTHLNPMTWNDGWPVIGIDREGRGTGEPVYSFKKPDVGKSHPVATPPDSDEFDHHELGLQWQWHANPRDTWAFLIPGTGQLRLFSHKIPEYATSYHHVPNLLLQKFPSNQFVVNTRMTFIPNERMDGERAGIIVTGRSYASLALEDRADGIYLVFHECRNASSGNPEVEHLAVKINSNTVYFMASVTPDSMVEFSYSTNGNDFVAIKPRFQAEKGQWIGSKIGLFCTRLETTNNSGFADFDYFRFSRR